MAQVIERLAAALFKSTVRCSHPHFLASWYILLAALSGPVTRIKARVGRFSAFEGSFAVMFFHVVCVLLLLNAFTLDNVVAQVFAVVDLNFSLMLTIRAGIGENGIN